MKKCLDCLIKCAYIFLALLLFLFFIVYPFIKTVYPSLIFDLYQVDANYWAMIGALSLPASVVIYFINRDSKEKAERKNLNNKIIRFISLLFDNLEQFTEDLLPLPHFSNESDFSNKDESNKILLDLVITFEMLSSISRTNYIDPDRRNLNLRMYIDKLIRLIYLINDKKDYIVSDGLTINNVNSNKLSDFYDGIHYKELNELFIKELAETEKPTLNGSRVIQLYTTVIYERQKTELKFIIDNSLLKLTLKKIEELLLK